MEPWPDMRWSRGTAAGLPAVRVRCADWQGLPWEHDVVLLGEPATEGVLFLTGGDPHPEDLAWAAGVARASGRPAAAVFQVPNQPRFGLVEDALIAHTFDRFLESGDPAWPLLRPMAAGAAAAAVAAGEAWGVGRWVVAGASKRAWTAWLAAQRWPSLFAGIASLAFDHLDARAQLARQQVVWGAPSPMYAPYLELDLPKRTEGPEGDPLIGLVDPAAGLDAMQAAVLLCTGANDPFWLLDASSAYWGRIRTPRFAAFRPNLGHALPSDPASVGAVGQFVRSCFGEAGLPVPALARLPGGRFVAEWEGDGAAWVWTAGAESPWFVESRWRPVPALASGEPCQAPDGLTDAPYQAAFVEVAGQGPGGPWSATSLPEVWGLATGSP